MTLQPADDGLAPDPGELRVGEILAHRYELLGLIGRGGMGEVWRARHILLRGIRAVKVIASRLSADPEFRRRFLKEGQTMMRVRHPAVIMVTDLDERAGTGQLFMVMEHLEGRTLADAITDADEPLSTNPREVARLLREVALGMQCIHDELIIHKDLKSENILLVSGEDGEFHPKVIDFGVAKEVDQRDAPGLGVGRGSSTADHRRTTLSGTPAYIAPELYRGESSTYRSDIYSFGVVAYECLSAGEFPHPAQSITELIRTHREGTSPVPLAAACPEVDAGLARLVEQCIAAQPEERPGSFREVAAALLRWLEAPEKRRRRTRLVAATGGVLVLALAAIWGIFFAGRTATLGSPQISTDGREIPSRAGRFHLAAHALQALTLSALVEGRTGKHRLELDGRRAPHPPRIWEDGGRLHACVDLSSMPDGAHTLALRAAADAAPLSVVLVVDRTPPEILSVQVNGSPSRFTAAEAPLVLVEVAESPIGIERVSAHLGSREFPARRPVDVGAAWTIAGTAEQDGSVELTIVVRDLAGNVTKVPFRFVRDTFAPRIEITDLVNGKEVRVRRATGAILEVGVDEAATICTRTPAEERETALDSSGAVRVALPGIPERGLPLHLAVRDLAGNETSRDLTVHRCEDRVTVQTPAGAQSIGVRPEEDLDLVITRPFPLGEGWGLEARRTRDPFGKDVPSPSLRVPFSITEGGPLRCSVTVEAGTLTQGAHELVVTDLSGSTCRPFHLVIDGQRPAISAIRFFDSERRPPGPTGWIRTAGILVEVDVDDLSLSRLELAGAPPQEPLTPGFNTYSFRIRIEDPGSHPLAYVLEDAAGNSCEGVGVVRADWTVPRILALVDPDPGRIYDDVELTRFRGRCSEAPFTLTISAGSKTFRFPVERPDFDVPVQLPAGEPLEVHVSAEDAASNRSEAVRRVLRVSHRETVLRDELTWTFGVRSIMRRVRPGDIAFGGRAWGVSEVFLDRTEVTNADYRRFLADTGSRDGHGPWCRPDEPKSWSHRPPAETWEDSRWNADGLPVVNVSWWDAVAFAGWSGRRLPTEAEWVKGAAKHREEPVLRAWPPFSEGTWRDGVLVTREKTGGTGPELAGEGEDVSPAGCLHMGGNVSEWVSTATGRPAGVRGGNWYLTRGAADVPGVPTKSYDPSLRRKTIGFRCVVDAAEVRRRMGEKR